MILMKKFKLYIQGMTCTGCEEHVAKALEERGDVNIEASFHHGEAGFELQDDSAAESAIQAIREAKYQPGEIVKVSSEEKVILGSEGDYDLLSIGSGGAAFSAAIKAIEYGVKVAMIERGRVGGTCVNIGCVPSKTLLRAGEINQLAKVNSFTGLQTYAGEVELATLIMQKNEMVCEHINIKYIDILIE